MHCSSMYASGEPIALSGFCSVSPFGSTIGRAFQLPGQPVRLWRMSTVRFEVRPSNGAMVGFLARLINRKRVEFCECHADMSKWDSTVTSFNPTRAKAQDALFGSLPAMMVDL